MTETKTTASGEPVRADSRVNLVRKHHAKRLDELGLRDVGATGLVRVLKELQWRSDNNTWQDVYEQRDLFAVAITELFSLCLMEIEDLGIDSGLR